jgi:translocation and assembly module TamA
MPRGSDVSVRTRGRAAVAPATRSVAVLSLLLAAGCLRARGTPEEPVVVAVDLQGVKAVDAEDLKDKLATKASDRFAWGEARRLDPDALAYDRRRIVAYYKQRGYYRAAVEDVEERKEGEGRVRVVIRIREGAPVRVARVDVEGLETAPEARAQAGKLAIEQGKIFTWAAYDAARAQLQAALVATGWATGQVTPTALVRGEEGTADVIYRVEPGPRFRFGAVTVTGTEAVPEGKIAARAARQVTPGDWYDERKLERIQSRVFELGVFSGVRVTHGTPDLGAGTVPVNVGVREAPFHTLRLGPGIGFDPSRTEVIGQASWVHRNWLGDLRRLRLDARAGYAWIPDPFSPIREGVVGTLGAEFSQPGVLGGDVVDLSIKVELEKSLEQAYGSTSEKFRFGTPLRPAPRWTVIPSYNLEIYQLRDLGGSPGDIPIQNCPSELCVLSYLE